MDMDRSYNLFKGIGFPSLTRVLCMRIYWPFNDTLRMQM